METETITQNNELVKVIETSGLDKTKAQVLLDKFTGYFEIAAEWERKTKELIVNDISQTTEMKMAREARLFLSKKRIDVEKTRKALKEDSLREGQTIDAIAKILKNLIEPIEKELEGKERFAEIKAAAELKAKQQAEAKAAKAPKKQKLNTWIDGFIMGVPTGMNEDETVIEILEKFEAFKKWAKTKIETV